MWKLSATLLIVVLDLFSINLAHAQTKPDPLQAIGVGIIKGEVRNASTKESLPSANILVVGTTLGAATDENGAFEIRNVPVGTHTVRVSMIGYQPSIRSDAIVNVARPCAIVFELTEGGIELDEVTVTSEYFQKLPDSPVSTRTQSSEEIRRLPNSLEDVVRAVATLPGVASVSPGRNDLIVRGGAPSENLYLVDNIEVPNINHFGTEGAGGGAASFINLDFVENTTFSSGGFGARYGDKLSSVLTIDLRDGRNDRLGGKGTISATQFGFHIEGPASEGGSFLLSARRSYLDFIFKAAGYSFVPEYWDFSGKVNHHLGPNDRLSVLMVTALDDMRFFNETADDRYDNSKILGSDEHQAIGGITWTHLFATGYSTITFSQTYVDFNYAQSDSLLQPLFQSSSIEQEWSLRADLVYRLTKATELTLGLTGKVTRFRSSVILSPFWTNFGQLLSVDAHYDALGGKGSAYAQVSQTVGDLRLTAGVRGDYFSLIESPIAVGPRLSASFDITPITTVNLIVGRYYQAPSDIWLTSHEGNRLLKHIRATQYVVGVDHNVRSDTRVSVEGYLKEYDQYPASIDRPFLVMANTGVSFGGSDDQYASFGIDRLVSAGSGQSKGAELLVQKKLSDIRWYGTFSVSYNRSMFKALDGIERPSNFDQRWIINVVAGYVLDEHWEFSAKFRYLTGRPYTPIDHSGAQSAELYNSLRLAATHSLDARADRRWQFSNWTLVAYIDIQNIYNRRPPSVPRYDVRTGKIAKDESVGIIPSIGVSAEF